jgi:hypothetical protein
MVSPNVQRFILGLWFALTVFAVGVCWKEAMNAMIARSSFHGLEDVFAAFLILLTIPAIIALVFGSTRFSQVHSRTRLNFIGLMMALVVASLPAFTGAAMVL